MYRYKTRISIVAPLLFYIINKQWPGHICFVFYYPSSHNISGSYDTSTSRVQLPSLFLSDKTYYKRRVWLRRNIHWH